MTNPDYRAMCAELVNDLEEYGEAVVDAGVGWVDPDTRELLIRARALLAEPEAVEPSDEELWTMYDEMRGEPGDWAWVRDYARAAIARWGHPTPQPPADGEVTELVADLNEIAQILCGMEKHRWAVKLTSAATLLERLASDNAGLEAAAESAYLDNLSLLDSQND